jgi:hypothetical protein
MPVRLALQQLAADQTTPQGFASGMQGVVRYESQDPVIAYGRSDDSPANPGSSMLRTPPGIPLAGQTRFVHVAMKGRFGYARRQWRALELSRVEPSYVESRVARMAAGTRTPEPAGDRGDTAQADGIRRWFDDVPQRTELRVPFIDDRVIRSNRAADPVSSIIDREGRRRS